MDVRAFPEERCVMCGQVIPEGRMVCRQCELRVAEKPAESVRQNKSPDKKLWGRLFRKR